jgi:hypothetical protein
MIEISDGINAQIGYGTLDRCEPYDYTLSIGIAIPATDDEDVITNLEYQVVNALKVWLLFHAPAGTRTGFVCAVED